jgi:hypothetical protein
MTDAAKANASVPGVTSASGPSWRRGLSALAEWLRANLFRPTAGPLGWRQIVGGVVFLIAGAAVSLARTTSPGALNSIWIEDATNLLNDALNKPTMTAVTTPINGYYESIGRVVTEIAVRFPLEVAPAIMAAAAALQYAAYGLIAYTASGPFLRSRWQRLLVAVPVCMIPLAYTQANNDLVTTQFFALYGCFWIFLWMPRTLVARVGSCLIMLAITLTSILPLVFAPLVAARLIANRSKHTIMLTVCWIAGLAVQWSVQLRGLSSRPTGWFTNPLWIIGQYVTHVVPRALFGETALGGPGTDVDGNARPLVIPDMAMHNVLIWGAWALVAVAVIIAVTKVTAPHWPLAITAFLFSVLIFIAEIVNNLAIVQSRYVIAPALLLYAGLVALLRPRGAAESSAEEDTSAAKAGSAGPGRLRGRRVVTWFPVAAFAVILAVTVGFNYRVTNYRNTGGSWTATVAKAQQMCGTPKGQEYLERHLGVDEYLYHHYWWKVYIPCSRVNSR